MKAGAPLICGRCRKRRQVQLFFFFCFSLFDIRHRQPAVRVLSGSLTATLSGLMTGGLALPRPTIFLCLGVLYGASFGHKNPYFPLDQTGCCSFSETSRPRAIYIFLPSFPVVGLFIFRSRGDRQRCRKINSAFVGSPPPLTVSFVCGPRGGRYATLSHYLGILISRLLFIAKRLFANETGPTTWTACFRNQFTLSFPGACSLRETFPAKNGDLSTPCCLELAAGNTLHFCISDFFGRISRRTVQVFAAPLYCPIAARSSLTSTLFSALLVDGLSLFLC